jgi:hypothetical protein
VTYRVVHFGTGYAGIHALRGIINHPELELAGLVVHSDDKAGKVGSGPKGGERLASHKAVVEAYVEGFRRTDHEAILACLADDVVWVLHGYRTLRGKEAFDAEIENDAAVGTREMTLTDAGRVPFVFTEVFTFTGDRISRLETFHINVGGDGDSLFTAPTA